MTRIELSSNGNSPFEKLIGHNKIILEKWIELENALFQETELDLNILEQIRRTIAFENGCEYCMVKGGKPNYSKEDKKISSACAFAQLFAIDHKSINEKHFEVLREDFTEKQISELCSFVSFITACQKLGNIYNLTEDYQKNGVTTLKKLRKEK